MCLFQNRQSVPLDYVVQDSSVIESLRFILDLGEQHKCFAEYF